MRLILASLMLLACNVARADSCEDYGYSVQKPWVVYGQTLINAYQSATNPSPNVNGILGEVPSLPYTVPEGSVLVLEALGIEPLWGAAMMPFIGTTGATAGNALATAQGQVVPSTSGVGNTQLWSGYKYMLPAGTVLNLFISTANAPSNGYIYGWYMGGKLCH